MVGRSWAFSDGIPGQGAAGPEDESLFLFGRRVLSVLQSMLNILFEFRVGDIHLGSPDKDAGKFVLVDGRALNAAGGARKEEDGRGIAVDQRLDAPDEIAGDEGIGVALLS